MKAKKEKDVSGFLFPVSGSPKRSSPPSPRRPVSLSPSRALLAWYDAHKRDLPWRGKKEPYAILVSELMLQQTTVKTVLAYYRPFLKAFPTAKALARAPESAVLRAWSGLGYYRRARHLQAAAKAIAGELKGRFPRTLEEIRALPGVGAYTAAAVASIAFGLAEPVLDGNVIRVMARLQALGEDPGLKAVQDKLRAEAGRFLVKGRAGDSNQALMELGATVCLPRNPLCGDCPLASLCKARKAGEQEKYPRARVRPRVEREEWMARVLYVETKVPRPARKILPLRRKGPVPSHEVRLLLVSRGPGEANEGLLEFPMERGRKAEGRKLGDVKHTIMSRQLHVHVLASELDRKRRDGEELILVQDVAKMPISGLTKKILALWNQAGAQGDLF